MRNFKGKSEDLKKCTLLVMRVAKTLKGVEYLTKSVPCDNCHKLIVKNKIKNVVFQEDYK